MMRMIVIMIMQLLVIITTINNVKLIIIIIIKIILIKFILIIILIKFITQILFTHSLTHTLTHSITHLPIITVLRTDMSLTSNSVISIKALTESGVTITYASIGTLDFGMQIICIHYRTFIVNE